MNSFIICYFFVFCLGGGVSRGSDSGVQSGVISKIYFYINLLAFFFATNLIHFCTYLKQLFSEFSYIHFKS